MSPLDLLAYGAIAVLVALLLLAAIGAGMMLILAVREAAARSQLDDRSKRGGAIGITLGTPKRDDR